MARAGAAGSSSCENVADSVRLASAYPLQSVVDHDAARSSRDVWYSDALVEIVAAADERHAVLEHDLEAGCVAARGVLREGLVRVEAALGDTLQESGAVIR